MSTLDKILIVDDDPEDRDIIYDAFSEIGEKNLVHFEENGELALKFLEHSYATGSLPPLVVLDLNMPRMNGTQTLQAIKDDPRFTGIQVIIYSTTLNPIEKGKCLQSGAKDFYIKPILYSESIKSAIYFKEVFEAAKFSHS